MKHILSARYVRKPPALVWWLSFVDPHKYDEKKPGQAFVGCLLVKGGTEDDLRSHPIVAKLFHDNPCMRCEGTAFEAIQFERVPDTYFNRLLTREEAAHVDNNLMGRLQ